MSRPAFDVALIFAHVCVYVCRSGGGGGGGGGEKKASHNFVGERGGPVGKNGTILVT